MESVIQASGISRRFGKVHAVDDVDLQIGTGAIVGLIGPNGAGKTTLLRTLLGLTEFQGDIEVMGACPRRQRAKLMEQVCFMADTAVLPRWMRVDQLLDYVAGLHPNFDRSRAEAFLDATDINRRSRVRQLSKGMVVQLHLSVVMAIDARVLILDEPTLGLDILFRKRFFEQLLNDYFDGERTIIISTHQVEEVQHILTEVKFMNRGKLVFQQSMADIEQDYVELQAVGESVARAESIPHLGSRNILGGKAFIYEGVPRDSLASLGELSTPSVSDLFVASMGESEHV
jgi:ABC-2 type transport system ATP-binding protein